MKKLVLNQLTLDKETIAMLDAKQLQAISGGFNTNNNTSACGSGGSACSNGNTTSCGSGGSICDMGGTSSGCRAGSSQCFVG